MSAPLRFCSSTKCAAIFARVVVLPTPVVPMKATTREPWGLRRSPSVNFMTCVRYPARTPAARESRLSKFTSVIEILPERSSHSSSWTSCRRSASRIETTSFGLFAAIMEASIVFICASSSSRRRIRSAEPSSADASGADGTAGSCAGAAAGS